MKSLSNYIRFVLSVSVCLFAGFIGSVFTYPYIRTWYFFLNKPVFSPPNWIFGPVWTTLYIMMGVALYLVWKNGIDDKKIRVAMYVFFGQLVLNSLWSIVFFGMQSPLGALFVIAALWAAILVTIVVFWRVSKWASMLLVPYICWVSFASVLNLSIWLLNR